LFFGADEQSAHNGTDVVHSGTLDLPNLYCNTNASVCVDMTGEPLRPDDELLKVMLDYSRPSELLFTPPSEEEHFATTAAVVRTLMRALTDMVQGFTAPAKKVPVQQHKDREASLFKTALTKHAGTLGGSHDADDAGGGVPALTLALPGEGAEVDLSDAFPVHMLEALSGTSSEVRELDLVVVLEWIVTIVLKNEQHVQFFWPDLNGKLCSTSDRSLFHILVILHFYVYPISVEFLKLVLEENVDLVAAKCPYFLERCIGTLVRAALMNFQSTGSSSNSALRKGLLTSAVLHSATVQAASRQACFDTVWKGLRLLRGVPSEVVANLSDRLGAGVLELIK
jgi:hypothetical protein